MNSNMIFNCRRAGIAIFAFSILLIGLITAPMRLAVAADCIVLRTGSSGPTTLRAAPAATSAARGQLKAGDSLPLVASMPRWFEARRADGQSVFASKRSTITAPCAIANAPSVAPVSPVSPAPAAAAFELHAIDVGTGLSVLVRGSDFALLYDAGSNDDLARGEDNRTIAYLKTLSPQLQSINHVILSHPHRDHVELLPDVIARFAPHDVWNSGAYNDICGYRNFLLAVAAEASVSYHTATHDEGSEDVDLNAKNCYGVAQPQQTVRLSHGQRIGPEPIALGQNASMTFLYADGSPHSSFNENSLVVRLDLGSHRVLFMGDGEAGGRKSPSKIPSGDSIEGKLLVCCAAEIKADVLVVGHHGSKTSSRAKFLAGVGAKYFVISAGPTKYGSVVLPDQEIVDEDEALGQVFRTDIEDDACAESSAKVGPDDDQKAGGCDNILMAIPSAGPITAAYRRVSD